jgi:hypothetical protein
LTPIQGSQEDVLDYNALAEESAAAAARQTLAKRISQALRSTPRSDDWNR